MTGRVSLGNCSGRKAPAEDRECCPLVSSPQELLGSNRRPLPEAQAKLPPSLEEQTGL